jgi:hypothetical protein
LASIGRRSEIFVIILETRSGWKIVAASRSRRGNTGGTNASVNALSEVRMRFSFFGSLKYANYQPLVENEGWTYE